MNTSSKHRKVFRNVLIALLSMAVLSAIVFGIVRHYEIEKELEPIRWSEFSPELWDEYPEYRHYMVEDMEAEIDIWNLSRKEIIDILGTEAGNIRESGTIRYKISDGFAFSRYYTISFAEDDEKVTDIFTDYDW